MFQASLLSSGLFGGPLLLFQSRLFGQPLAFLLFQTSFLSSRLFRGSLALFLQPRLFGGHPLECRRPKAGSGFIREAPRTHVLGYVCVALRVFYSVAGLKPGS